MGLNKFSIKLFLFMILISFLGFGFFWSFSSSQLIITKIVIGALFLLFFILLLLYINKTNRDLYHFLNAIKSRESISSYSNDLSFDQLSITYNEITDQLKKAWLAKEHEHHYFQNTIENINVGVISFDEHGDIQLINKAAKQILGITSIRNVSELNSETILFGDELKDIKPEESRLLKMNTQIDQLKVLVRCSVIKVQSKYIKIISLQNIKTQLEESELEAWQKLIKILTHEIMNSVTPIKSLTYSMQKSLKDGTNDEVDSGILKGLQAIEKRSKGLLDFVESYKSLTQIQKPAYERVHIGNMIENVKVLLKSELNEQSIVFNATMTPQDINIIADGKLIAQVVVNLVLNSIKALKNSKQKNINIDSYINNNGRVSIKITDSGSGINSETLDKIFIPFYSTYQDGSGIGLSFARQVMVLHNGRIDVNSQEGKGASFTLSF